MGARPVNALILAHPGLCLGAALGFGIVIGIVAVEVMLNLAERK